MTPKTNNVKLQNSNNQRSFAFFVLQHHVLLACSLSLCMHVVSCLPGCLFARLLRREHTHTRHARARTTHTTTQNNQQTGANKFDLRALFKLPAR